MHSTRLVLGAAILLVGCGSHPPPPPAASHESIADASATHDDVASANTDAGFSGGAVASASTVDAGASSDVASSAHGDVHSDDSTDQCDFAGAAFEKRARPAIKACYREGKKKDANLVGGVRIVANVTSAGKVGNIISSPNGDKPMLPAPVVKCMVDAVKKNEPGDIDKCKGKTVVLPIQFPSQ